MARRNGQHLILLAACACGWPVAAENAIGINSFGMPGLIDMPSAQSLPDGELVSSTSQAKDQFRQTLTFQITPRLTGAFRYSIVDGINTNPDGTLGATRYDRSFDLHFRFVDEGPVMPAVAVGLRDFIGTGLYAGEYVVATKTLTPRFRLTGGIGWGRLGSYGSFDNPLGVLDDAFDSRPIRDGFGGEANINHLFRGPAALFGGVTWQATDKLSFSAEYSSDEYGTETAAGLFDHKSPFNLGFTYQPSPGISLAGRYVYGADVGLTATFQLNPRRSPIGDRAPAPAPVRPRSGGGDWTGDSLIDGGAQDSLRSRTAKALSGEGLVLEAMEITPDSVRLRYRNTRFGSSPQAMGRAARVLTAVLPPSVERIVLEPVVEGMAVSQVQIARSDLELLEHDVDGAWRMYARAQITDPGAAPFDPAARLPQPRLTWGIGPYTSTSLFDPDNPFRLDVGLELSARYDFAPGLSVSGQVRQKAFGNLDASTRPSTSVLQHVRSDAYLYARNEGPTLERLTFDYFARPGRDLYSRLSVGYLESMYAGASAELLWKPHGNRLALGAEVNYVQQRDFDKAFGLQDYSVATGHLSAYYDAGSGYDVQLDVGRYLAGDWGATLGVDRTFNNGWSLGAYFTLTDVPFDEFGEGSFDKGIRMSIPLTWALGQPSRKTSDFLIQPVLRDGGARLRVNNRLYDMVRGDQDPVLREQWGRFWK